MRHAPKQITDSSWQYGTTIIREEDTEYQVLVDFPWGDEPVLMSTHPTFDRALVWIDRVEDSFASHPLTCKGCGDDIQGASVDDEGHSYCRECAVEVPAWNGVCDDRR